MLGPKSTSFMKDLVNSTINMTGNKLWTNNKKSVGRPTEETYINNIRNDGIEAPQCIVDPQSFSACTTIVSSGGDIDNNYIEQATHCGGDNAAGSRLKSDMTDGEIALAAWRAQSSDLRKPIPACAALKIVPECTDNTWSRTTLAAGSATRADSITGVSSYQGCCSGGDDLPKDCPEPVSGVCPGTGGSPTGADLTPEEITVQSLTIKVGHLTTRVRTASDTAIASKSAYPEDLLIVTKADKVIEETAAHVVTIASVELDVEAAEQSGVTDTADASITALTSAIVQTEIITNELIKRIKANYIFGVKKMYVFGGIGALIFIIILIVLLKKK